ncbi:DNA mismatch repair endonuclease MutL [Fervidibacillus halotolerans]|uniref:DNA mismatch repair protein MutL n=1 Tax=Fervidibacillus halotolerans TaxID=2980027 RepID=A0A9E8S1H1_9BACI|nr:DNA mismatch repair endonuclease MutL [Fervidibacillus halotolerans]WAA13517.1 DNA mismatch repair endonuclease MutL [Fervidibacillus halotolerans]
MGKIIQLNEQLSNKIAAGEVVERPASVVKELIENAIDANSTVIQVEVEEAGLAKIRVIDNGDGMEEDDALLAFERHATSKIKDEVDLFRIQTLGFRGEALPSIASVSQMEMITSTGEKPGIRIVIKGGKRIAKEIAPSRKGTEIIVTDLFYNTPARLKYMKSIHTELGNITDVMNKMALAHPEIAMKLIHNGRKLLQTAGNGDTLQVLASIYGINTAKKMIPIASESLDFEISGYIALPEVNRASRNYISTMINGRYIKNYALNRAIISGYHTLLPIGRYPIAFLHIKMDPKLVDVNVHPAKMEVRISKEQSLCDLITKTIQEAFRKESLIPSIAKKEKGKRKSEQIQFQLDHLQKRNENKHRSYLTKKEREVAQSFLKSFTERDDDEKEKPEIDDSNPQLKTNKDPLKEPYELSPVKDTISSEGDMPFIKEGKGETFEEKPGEKETRVEDIENPSKETERIPPLYPIGQMHGTYILAENENGLFIIDQHAAQERIKYEYYREKIGEVQNELQEMLIPMTLQFSNDEYVKLQDHLDELKTFGVFLEPFGTNTFMIRNHPQWFPPGEEETMIRHIIDQVLTMKHVDLKKLREETAIMMSCKGSIKANHRLRNDEILQLLDTLRTTKDPFTCPHGRPIIIHFSTYDLEKMFKRIM